MSTKRGRSDDDQSSIGWQSYTKHGRQENPTVNTLNLMMQAARALNNKQNTMGGDVQQQRGLQQAAYPTIPCTHCGRQLSESQVRQCCQCQDVYCSTCSVPDYSEREDRIFCLECNAHGQGADNSCTNYHSIGANRQGQHTTAAAAAALCAAWSSPQPNFHASRVPVTPGPGTGPRQATNTFGMASMTGHVGTPGRPHAFPSIAGFQCSPAVGSAGVHHGSMSAGLGMGANVFGGGSPWAGQPTAATPMR